MRGTFCVQLPAQPRASKGTSLYYLPKRDVLAYTRTSEIALKEAPLHHKYIEIEREKAAENANERSCELLRSRPAPDEKLRITVPKMRKILPGRKNENIPSEKDVRPEVNILAGLGGLGEPKYLRSQRLLFSENHLCLIAHVQIASSARERSCLFLPRKHLHRRTIKSSSNFDE